MKADALGKSVLYVTSPSLADGTTLFVLSPGSTGRKVWCCVKVDGKAPETEADQNFLSSPDGTEPSGLVQREYLVTPVRGSGATPKGLNIVVKAKTVVAADDGYQATDDRGNAYLIDSCLGTEGINVYLRDGRTHVVLDHYYGYLNYDIESDCPSPEPSSKR